MFALPILSSTFAKNLRRYHMPTQTPGFGRRLAYLMWVRPAAFGLPAMSNADLVRELDVTPSWATKWLARQDAPDSMTVRDKMDRLFPGFADWLMRGTGDPPHPVLWARWTGAVRPDVPLRDMPDPQAGTAYQMTVRGKRIEPGQPVAERKTPAPSKRAGGKGA